VERNIIVIGASAGGVSALQTLVAGLPQSLKASLFIVMHRPASWPGRFPRSSVVPAHCPSYTRQRGW
jgi:two-component system, chemotaxis family, protein-glutamate methylesterase/glutaminase